MVAGLDMTLDDIIKKNKKSNANKGDSGVGSRGNVSAGRGRGRIGGRLHDNAPGPTRRLLERAPSKMMPYSRQPGLHMRGMRTVGGASHGNAGTALHVSNLSYDVNHADIQVLFSDVGDLKYYKVHYDGSGRSKGIAEVVFERDSDALAAIRRYNNRCLDGKPLKVVLMDSNVVTSSVPPASHDTDTQRGSHGRGDVLVRVQGRVKKRGLREKILAEALDADLEKYHEEAMGTSDFIFASY